MRYKVKVLVLTILIFLSFIIILLYQLYWIGNFYKTQSAQLEEDIMIAMRNADYQEINWRIGLLRLDAAIRKDSYSLSLLEYLLIYDKQNSDYDLSGEKEFLTPDSSSENKENPLLEDLQKGLHQRIRTLKDVDFHVYNNLLKIELNRKGIRLESFTELIDLDTGNILEQIPDNISFNKEKFREYIFPYDLDGKYAYRLYLQHPKMFILKEMSGIIIASLLIILFLILSYWFILRSVFKQKTLDELKSDFVNNMTHELKTPLSVAYAAIDALRNYRMKEDPDKNKEYLSIAAEQLSHLNGLVEQLLTMSVEERKNLKLFSETILLKDLFIQLKNQYLLNTEKEINFIIDVVPSRLTVKADKIHFKNILGNLIENSIKYSGEKVTITLYAREENHKIRITVKDNGIGIPASSLPKVFDRFYRVSTGNIHSVKGYGLGLSYVKTIVEKHNGQISVKSMEGEGSEFTIIL